MEEINKETSFVEKRQQLWDSFSKEQQLELFCHVVAKLKHAELIEQRSYRGVLYSEFGFGPEAYGAAQLSGFLELHNCIYSKEVDCVNIIQKGLRLFGIDVQKEEIQARIQREYSTT